MATRRMSYRVFRWLWRFNAVVFAIAGILLIAVLVFALSEIIGRELLYARPSIGITDLPERAPEERTEIFGEPDAVRGTDVVVVPLRPGDWQRRSGPSGYAFKSVRTARNLLFIDIRSGERRWLLPDDRSLIFEFASFPRDDWRGSTLPAKAIVYNVIKADSNGNGGLGPGDFITVAVSKVDSTGYTELISDIGTVFGATSVGNDWVVVAYEQKGEAHTATIDLERNVIVSIGPAPALPAQ